MQALRERTAGLLLLTATPMQVSPIQVWDLLALLGLPAEWHPQAFLDFFDHAARPNPSHDQLRYHAAGKLKTPIATRRVEDRFVEMTEAERQVYEQVEDYIGSTYNNAAADERTAVGFVMTIYRRRLASSFQALIKTLDRRLAVIGEHLAPGQDLSLERPEDRALARANLVADIESGLTTAEQAGFDLDEVTAEELDEPPRPPAAYGLAELGTLLGHPGLLPPGVVSKVLGSRVSGLVVACARYGGTRACHH